ncbi:MAG: IPExxxVDY family protein [Sediminicola sp.]
MAAVYKISDDFYEDSFALIALHSSLEDHSLVYALNHCLKANLKRSKRDLDISEDVSFPLFEWKDIDSDSYWTLITNLSIVTGDLRPGGLFENEPSFTKSYLVPEFKEVDYFLKVEQGSEELRSKALKSILSIPRVVTAYTIDNKKLKSKNNLIF